jgi:L-rhamnose mutarotase
MKWSGQIDKKEVVDFIETEFDLLISYYDVEKSGLLQITQLSKANFKVGFSSIDKRINHFMINTNAENYSVFVSELFKYLKILNKI